MGLEASRRDIAKNVKLVAKVCIFSDISGILDVSVGPSLAGSRS